VTDQTEAREPSDTKMPIESEMPASSTLESAGPEAPAFSAEETEKAIATFRSQLQGQVSVPATLVQDRLLDLWGKLPEGDPRSEVERWLTETLQRQLYVVADVDKRLESVFSGN